MATTGPIVIAMGSLDRARVRVPHVRCINIKITYVNTSSSSRISYALHLLTNNATMPKL